MMKEICTFMNKRIKAYALVSDEKQRSRTVYVSDVDTSRSRLLLCDTIGDIGVLLDCARF